MPSVCTNTHSSRVQGPGLCCQHVGVDLIDPKGASLPVYVRGLLASNPGSFPHVQVTDSGGHCGTCMIVGTRRSPTVHVLKFVRGGPGCPSKRTGCCALTA